MNLREGVTFTVLTVVKRMACVANQVSCRVQRRETAVPNPYSFDFALESGDYLEYSAKSRSCLQLIWNAKPAAYVDELEVYANFVVNTA
jgi:uncharacterized protein YycO